MSKKNRNEQKQENLIEDNAPEVKDAPETPETETASHFTPKTLALKSANLFFEALKGLEDENGIAFEDEALQASYLETKNALSAVTLRVVMTTQQKLDKAQKEFSNAMTAGNSDEVMKLSTTIRNLKKQLAKETPAAKVETEKEVATATV